MSTYVKYAIWKGTAVLLRSGAKLPFMIQNLYLAPSKPSAGPAYTLTRLQPKDWRLFWFCQQLSAAVGTLQDVEKPAWAH